MYRPFVEEGMVTHPQDVGDACREMAAAIRMCLIKRIVEDSQYDHGWIQREPYKRLEWIINTRFFEGTMIPDKMYINVGGPDGGRIAVDPQAICLWKNKIWMMDATREWKEQDEIQAKQQNEIHEIAKIRHVEVTRMMRTIGQDYVDHRRLEKRLEAIFPDWMGGVYQGVASFEQQTNRMTKTNLDRTEWQQGEDMSPYMGMPEYERTIRVLDQLDRIEQTHGMDKLNSMHKLYQTLRRLISTPKSDRTIKLKKKYIIELPKVGNITDETRRTRLTYAFGKTEQKSPMRSELCLRFLRGLREAMEQDKPIQPRVYGQEDARRLMKANIGGDLFQDTEGLSYPEMAIKMIEKYVHKDPQEALTEVTGARKPLGHPWRNYLEYILSMTEMVSKENADEGEVQERLARIIILTQLDPLSRNMIYIRERYDDRKFDLRELCAYADIKFMRALQTAVTGITQEINVPENYGVPVLATREKGRGWEEREKLRLMTNDYTWIGEKVNVTQRYLGKKETIYHAEIKPDFTFSINNKDFEMPEGTFDKLNRIQRGTIVAHAMKRSMETCDDLQTSLNLHEVSKVIQRCKEECGDGACTCLIDAGLCTAPQEPPTEEDDNSDTSIITFESEESTSDEETSADGVIENLPSVTKMLESAERISDRITRLEKTLEARTVSRMETDDMPPKEKVKLRKMIKGVSTECEVRKILHSEMIETMINDNVQQAMHVSIR